MIAINTCVVEDAVIQELKHNCTMYKAWYATRMREEVFSTTVYNESRSGMIRNSGLHGGLGLARRRKSTHWVRGDTRVSIYIFLNFIL